MTRNPTESRANEPTRARLLTLTPEAYTEVAALLSSRESPHASERSSARIIIESPRLVPVTIEHLGGGTRELECYLYDLSLSGACILHGGYIHPGSWCRVGLMENRQNAAAMHVTGRAAVCTNVRGPIHAIGIRFDSAIDLRRFVDSKAFATSLAHNLLAHPKSLEGRVLVVEDQEIDADLCRVALSNTSVEIERVATADEARSRLASSRYDCLAVDLCLPDAKGEDLILSARREGFRNPIIAVTGVNDQERLNALERNLGVSVVRKPYDPDQLLGVVAHALSTVPIPTSTSRLQSKLSDAEADRMNLGQYLRRVDEAIAQIERNLSDGDFELTRAVCQSLRSSGTLYGYPLLSSAGEVAVKALDATQSIDEAKGDLQGLIQVARRLAM